MGNSKQDLGTSQEGPVFEKIAECWKRSTAVSYDLVMTPILHEAPPVSIHGLTVDRGRRPVLQDLGLSLAAGERVGVIGANGSGKSTLLLTLAGLIPSRSGEVRIGGHPPGSRAAAAVLGWLPDVPIHPRLSVASLVAVVAGLHGLPVPDLASLDLAGIPPRRRADRLSQGQARRLALALALLHTPSLLLLDEPTTALDRDAVASLHARLRGFDGTVLATAHHPDDLHGLVDRVLYLRDGRLEDT